MGSTASKVSRTGAALPRKYPTRSPPTSNPTTSSRPTQSPSTATSTNPEPGPFPNLEATADSITQTDTSTAAHLSHLRRLGPVPSNPFARSSITSTSQSDTTTSSSTAAPVKTSIFLNPSSSSSSPSPSSAPATPTTTTLPASNQPTRPPSHQHQQHPSLSALAARDRAANRYEQERARLGQRGFEGRTLVDAWTLEMGVARMEGAVRAKGKGEEGAEEQVGVIEREMRLKRGILSALGVGEVLGVVRGGKSML